ncbi:hypothetical protein OD91_0676 [Lutibacter sp. Hel_I_33_5]|uniref:glycoside hydrolase family 113 n=1 Tax=Lutibacter sp. Hel_I_33_5 TaxID=1566289 RepID=UPI0011A063CB|nr:hypothetical protein [Lutibacter sp. Hel_I_33_5]TVZ55428.1 hypothetical protein OD91_0676 [Lutibacter sp. Hel_I_33_5]
MNFKKTIAQILKVYFFTWAFSFLLFAYFGFSNSSNFRELSSSFFKFTTSKSGVITVHILFIIFFILFLILKYFISTYKKQGLKITLKRVVFRLILPISILVFTLKFILYQNNNEGFNYNWNSIAENKTNTSKKRFLNDSKIRGMSVYRIGRNRKLDLSELIKTNIEWVAVIPYFYQETEKTIKINTPDEIGVWSRRDSALIKGIQKSHEKGLFVMLKPHLWMSSGWRSNINFKNKSDWDSWFKNYRINILHYAKMAQKTNSELYCIGTELRSSLKHQPKKWLALIKEIKSMYSGKLTYAANWDDPHNFSEFWEEMDYIGIQGYYPLTENSEPNLEEIKNGWDKHIKTLKALSKSYNKQILFTEVGYRNDYSATVKPWEWGNSFQQLTKKKSDRTQQLAYEALFQKLWKEDWFAGLFPWEWNSGDFPIYQKPSQNTITIWYHK